ncbi:hypothetical protein B0H14DRAFT_2628033 [Mycena olivaceomarginata]|nr:hypothetical protein B0H14DRAFT_2628033 [Mycena olivaceomarginata]
MAAAGEGEGRGKERLLEHQQVPEKAGNIIEASRLRGGSGPVRPFVVIQTKWPKRGLTRFVVAGGNFNNITNITHPIPESDPMGKDPGRGLFRPIPELTPPSPQTLKRSSSASWTYYTRYDWTNKITLFNTKWEHGSEKYTQRGCKAASRKCWCLRIRERPARRHPNFPQLYAISRSSALQATIFHDVSTVYSWGFLRHCRFTDMPESLSVTVGSIIWGPHSENPVTIGYVPVVNFRYFWWTVDDGTSDVFFTERKDPSDTWLRIESCGVAGIKDISCLFTGVSAAKAWLTQANYLFQQLNAIPAYHEDFSKCVTGSSTHPRKLMARSTALVTNVSYRLSTLDNVENLPAGYLFICPLEDIQCGIADQPVYYWSLDSSGAEPLTEEEAEQLGFPFFQLEMGGYSEYTNTSTESDEEESDENVGDEVENWDTTSVAGEDAEPPRFSRVDKAEMLPCTSSFVLVAWVQFTLIVINLFLLGVQFLGNHSSRAPAKSIQKKKRPPRPSWNAMSEGNRAAPYGPRRRKKLTPTNLVNLLEGIGR